MPIDKYTYKGPIDHTIPVDTSKIAGKTVIITGGANGMGETCVRHFAAAGANVTIADVNKRGYEIADELNKKYGSERAIFVEVDIRDWEQQKKMFDTTLTKFGATDVVIANAGISRSSGDSLWNLDDPSNEPVKPDLRIVDVNLKGSFYTWKLAVHYWRKQEENEERDRCFIITGSMVGWIDSPVRSCSVSFVSVLTFAGQLGVYINKIRAAWLHAYCSTEQLGTRYSYQLCRTVLDQECDSNERVREVAGGPWH